jgi:hypothetical protein
LRVFEDPVGDDLMYRQMHLGVDGPTADLELGRPVLDRLPEPGMLRSDQQPSIIFVVGVEERDVNVVQDVVSGSEQPLDATFSVVHAGSVPTRSGTDPASAGVALEGAAFVVVRARP